jgi:hypothetical protein
MSMSYEEELNISFATESLVFVLNKEDIVDFTTDTEDIAYDQSEGSIFVDIATAMFKSSVIQRAIEFGEDLVELSRPDTVEISDDETFSMEISSFMKKYNIDDKWGYFIEAIADDYKDVPVDEIASIFSYVYNTKLRTENRSTIAVYKLDFALIEYLAEILSDADLIQPITSEDEIVDYSFYINKKKQPVFVLNTVADTDEDELF